MSQMAYHMEALRRQRVVDRRTEALKKMADVQARTEAKLRDAALDESDRQRRDSSRQKKLKDQLDERDWRAVKKTHKDRDREIERLLRERSWHDGLIAKMEQQEKDDLLMDLLKDHQHKAKVLRDHGLYRGHPSVFTTDPKV